MREIKFRAWVGGKVGNINFGETYRMEYNVTLFNGAYASFVGGCEIYGDHPEVPLMQYTGFKDKNGKEIYEGDILQFSDKWEWYRCQYGFSKTREEIEALPYARGAITWSERDGSWEHIGGTSDLNSYLEIIGNIYENPELLTDITSDKTDV